MGLPKAIEFYWRFKYAGKGMTFFFTPDLPHSAVLSSKGSIYNLLMQFFALGSSKIKVSEREGGLFKSTTPPLCAAPQSFRTHLSPILDLWTNAGAKGAKIWPPKRVFSFALCVYTQNTQNLVENSKMDEKHKKIFDPQLDL